MIKCTNCDKVLKHKGALNGHLAFAHGVTRPRQLKLDEIREELNRLRSEMDNILSCFCVAEIGRSGGNIKHLVCYDNLRNSYILLKELSSCERRLATKQKFQ